MYLMLCLKTKYKPLQYWEGKSIAAALLQGWIWPFYLFGPYGQGICFAELPIIPGLKAWTSLIAGP